MIVIHVPSVEFYNLFHTEGKFLVGLLDPFVILYATVQQISVTYVGLL